MTQLVVNLEGSSRAVAGVQASPVACIAGLTTWGAHQAVATDDLCCKRAAWHDGVQWPSCLVVDFFVQTSAQPCASNNVSISIEVAITLYNTTTLDAANSTLSPCVHTTRCLTSTELPSTAPMMWTMHSTIRAPTWVSPGACAIRPRSVILLRINRLAAVSHGTVQGPNAQPLLPETVPLVEDGLVMDAQRSSAAVVDASKTDAPEDVDERERLRRLRISSANKGKVPWNKGRKHSPGAVAEVKHHLRTPDIHTCTETIAKIRERTKAAMRRPDVKSKVLAQKHTPHSAETKVCRCVCTRVCVCKTHTASYRPRSARQCVPPAPSVSLTPPLLETAALAPKQAARRCVPIHDAHPRNAPPPRCTGGHCVQGAAAAAGSSG